MSKVYFKIAVLILIVNAWLFTTYPGAAKRLTPQDVINSKKEAYNQKIQNYSLTHKKQLEEIGLEIARINKLRTDQLAYLMELQAMILDQYQARNNGQTNDSMEKARYWITYAHEAVAYQAAKIYIFELRSEQSIRLDVSSLISLVQSDLNSTRDKVIYSQKILKLAIK